MSNRDCRFEAGERDIEGVAAAPTSPARTREASEAALVGFSGRGLERASAILARAATPERVMPPTELFNEGWLLRLALDWFASRPDVGGPLSVPTGSRWYSEALLPSRFAARTRGDSLAETHTHADGAIGHFKIGDSGEGDLALDAGAKQFVLLEAKVNSKLSPGVKNAPGFDQAARSVACVAHILSIAGVRPEQMPGLGFFVVAPASQIARDNFSNELRKDSIRRKVEVRVAQYESRKYDAWLAEWFLPVLAAIEIATVSWEDVATVIESNDVGGGGWFREFYERCLYYNRLT